MDLWRVSAYPGLGGMGGNWADGRWHTRGRPILYLGETPALALLEVMAHLELTLDLVPDNLKLIRVQVAEGASIQDVQPLPAGWQANAVMTRRIGNPWHGQAGSLLLRVPSALIAHSHNHLVNPLHPQASTHLREMSMEPVWIDSRFLR